MSKDFLKWHHKKTKIENTTTPKYFYTREIWFIAMGINIGVEEDGKGTEYRRPVIIMKRFNQNMFMGIPISRTNKDGPYYFSFVLNEKVANKALISQIRLYDSKRLLSKIGVVDHETFAKIQKEIRDKIFSD